MAERVLRILKINRLLSLLLTEITLVMLGTGYAMTFIGVNIPILRVIHFIFVIVFVPAFASHTVISIYIIRYRWKPSISSILEGKGDTITKLRLLQRLSSIGLLIVGTLQVLTGLDWFKLGLSSLLPYPVHRRTDFFLFIFLIAHLSTAAYFQLLRKRAQKEATQRTIDLERRNAIKIAGGAIIAFFAALILDKPLKIGTDITGASGRLPPGQSEIEQLKVFSAGIGIPSWDPVTWRFEVTGEVENSISLNYAEFRELPSVIKIADFHCVTGWSKFDNVWEGVSFGHIVKLAKLKSNAKYATIECLRGYTTSLPISELARSDVLLAYRLDGRELPREHGGPLRLVVPFKYGYKSAKWVLRIKFTEVQELGYWEQRGYSNTANPFTNDRYSIPVARAFNRVTKSLTYFTRWNRSDVLSQAPSARCVC